MMSEKLHEDLIVIDGLNISKWNREVFEDMRKGELQRQIVPVQYGGINEFS